MKTVASWQHLMMLAKELGDARKSGDADEIQRDQQAHDSYRDLCLCADSMMLGMIIGVFVEVFKRG